MRKKIMLKDLRIGRRNFKNFLKKDAEDSKYLYHFDEHNTIVTYDYEDITKTLNTPILNISKVTEEEKCEIHEERKNYLQTPFKNFPVEFYEDNKLYGDWWRIFNTETRKITYVIISHYDKIENNDIIEELFDKKFNICNWNYELKFKRIIKDGKKTNFFQWLSDDVSKYDIVRSISKAPNLNIEKLDKICFELNTMIYNKESSIFFKRKTGHSHEISVELSYQDNRTLLEIFTDIINRKNIDTTYNKYEKEDLIKQYIADNDINLEDLLN